MVKMNMLLDKHKCVVVCKAQLGSKVQAQAQLHMAWAFQNLKLGPGGGLRLSPGMAQAWATAYK